MEREEYQKPEIVSDIIDIGVYGFYYENEDGDPVSPFKGNNGKRTRTRGKH